MELKLFCCSDLNWKHNNQSNNQTNLTDIDLNGAEKCFMCFCLQVRRKQTRIGWKKKLFWPAFLPYLNLASGWSLFPTVVIWLSRLPPFPVSEKPCDLKGCPMLHVSYSERQTDRRALIQQPNNAASVRLGIKCFLCLFMAQVDSLHSSQG